MEHLKKIIIEKIKREGPITFNAFMDIALYYPGLGYYTSPETVIGRKGDFYTSPHQHRIFGVMIGRQLEEMWAFMGKQPVFHVIEIGAGAGHLCRDILEYARNREIFGALQYAVVELNPWLAEKQKALLSAFSGKVRWASSLRELRKVRGCILSNELLDSFPVHVIEMEDTLKEIYVSSDGKDICEQKLDVSTHHIFDYLDTYGIRLPLGNRTEINLKIRDWLRDVSEIHHDGFIITIDYGYASVEYYDPERARGTLLCYRGHRTNENTYEAVGKQDITAHVNFSSLAAWGEECGYRTVGYCPQGTFLISLGIDEVIEELYGNSPDYASQVLQVKGLLLPQGTGESHKVLVQYRGEGLPALRGFSIRNKAASLT